MKRRDVIKGLSMLPFVGAASSTFGSFGSRQMVGRFSEGTSEFMEIGPRIFQSIGVEPIINCRGTFTIIGGSVELPDVKAAIHAAADHFVQYDELAEGVGRHLAKLTGAEWGMVSSGCAAGMKHVTAACVTGGNPEKLIKLPDLTGFEKTEVIIPRHSRNVYDHAIRNIGVEIITVETLEELKGAISSRTAMIYLLSHASSSTNELSLEAIAAAVSDKHIPILVDAAAENLTIPNIHLQRGATVVTYSGGKVMCGPQGAGLILGKKSILKAAWQASAPHHGIGRDNKVGREETLGMVAAVEAWIKRDHDSEWKKWLSWLDAISQKVSSIPGISTQVHEPAGLSNHSPVLSIRWSPDLFHVSGEEIADELAHTKPRIALGGSLGRYQQEEGQTGITITAFQMQDGNAAIVADRVYEVLNVKRAPKPVMAAAGHDIAGQWDVTIDFFDDQGTHQFYIEQDGNWLNGTHQGDFYSRQLIGTIEGNDVKFRSVFRQPGDVLVYSFSGKINGDVIKGDLHMGEYLECTFTAIKRQYSGEREAIKIPVGPPLAT